jgi:SNF2 family DNA or RNA helicase/HJR/Mrr/RecB family endonuclease
MVLQNILNSIIKRKNNKSPLRYIPDSQGIGIELPENVINEARRGNGDELVLYQYMVFQMLLEEGFAEEIKNGIYLESNNAVRLDFETRTLLTLPDPWIGSFRIQLYATTLSTDFRLHLLLIIPNGEVIRNYSLKGPVLSISKDETYLPDPLQWDALSAVSDHSQLSELERNEFNNLSAIHQLVSAEKSGLDIDLSAFKDKNTIQPERVGLSIQEEDDGSLTLIPSFGSNIPPEDINERLGQISPDSRAKSLRVRQSIILLNEEKLKAAHEIISNNRIPADIKKTFFENPSAFLDATLVDLDIGFSFRVKGAGPFKHGYLGETDESGLDWFDRKDDPISQAIKLSNQSELEKIITNSDSLEKFQQRFEDALSTGASSMEFGGKNIDISNSQNIGQFLKDIKQKFEDLESGSLDEEKTIEKDESEDAEESSEAQVLDIHLQDTKISVGLREDIAPPLYLQSGLDIDFKSYKRQPYSHQEEGIRWLLSLILNEEEITDPELRRTGALLADDMGLGKSYTTLVGINELFSQKNGQIKNKPFLIVAPLVLLETWRREIEYTYLHSPFTRTIILQANEDLPKYRLPRHSAEIHNQPIACSEDICEDLTKYVRFSLKVGNKFGSERLDQPQTLILTTFQTLRDYQFSLCLVDWGVAIFDEAQNIKNPNALQTRAAKSLKADFKLLLTGTPVENHLGDFWCLIDTIQTGFLGHYQQFRKDYIKPILSAPSSEASKTRGEIGKKLRSRIGGYMMRRVKEDHLDGLPNKKIFIGHELFEGKQYELDSSLSKNMHGIQRARYEAIINATKDAIDSKAGRGAALKGLHQLKDVSLHPDLLEKGIPQIPKRVEDIRNIFLRSGKLEILLDIIEKIRHRDEKAIIFVINRNLQRFLSVGLQKIFKIKVNIINGDTKAVSKKKTSQTRQSIIDEFQSFPGFGILIMSPIAAGVGVTITAANNVIHLERHWNPAKESQASDRVYRIGQEKDVNIYIPILFHPEMDSFDVNLNKLLMSKTGIKDAIISPEHVQFSDFVNMGMFGRKAKVKSRIKIDEIQSFSGELFEALIAEIYSRNSDQVFLTPISGDRGCDVVVISERKGNKLVQCKKTQSIGVLEGYTFINEVYASKPYYEIKFDKKFEILEVYTNAKKYSRKGWKAAKNYNVQLKQQSHLIEAIKKYEITFEQLLYRNNNRISL